MSTRAIGNILIKYIGVGLMAFSAFAAINANASPSYARDYKISPSTQEFQEKNYLGRRSPESHPAAAELVSPILGLLPADSNTALKTAPEASAFALNGVRDSQIIRRLRQPRETASAGRVPRHANALFQSVGIAYGKLPALTRMVPVEKDIAGGFARNCATTRCERSAAQLSALVEQEKRHGFTRLMNAVNAGVNSLVRYQPDRATYRQLDFWANPSTTLNRGTGDCEDYAILKMAILAKAGVPRSSMSIVVLRDQRRNVYHAVLSIRTTGGNFILDNVREQVLVDTALPDYLPLYSVSEGRGQIYGQPVSGTRMVASLDSLDMIAPGEGQDIGDFANDFAAQSGDLLAAGPR